MTARRLFAGILAFGLVTHNGHAQSVPAISLDVDAGSGPTSTHAGSTWFRSAYSYMTNADLAVRIGGAGMTRPVIVFGYSFALFPADELTDCPLGPLGPSGGCEVYFPHTTGPSIGVGLRQGMGQRFLLGVTGGVASYSRQAWFADLNASWRVISHVAVVGEFRYVNLGFDDQRVWWRPLTFGARLSW